MYWSLRVPIKILVPRRLADRCYLAEALLWVSVSRFPLADLTRVPRDGKKWAEIDTRESPDHMALGIPLFLDTLIALVSRPIPTMTGSNLSVSVKDLLGEASSVLSWSRNCKPPSLSRNDERIGMDFAIAFSIPTTPGFS